MNIIYEPEFVNGFNNIWDYISLDSKIRANQFKSELKEKIENLVHMPYKFRKSFYFDNENIRDMTFKGYVIPYKIDKISKEIIIIGIKKYQENL